MSGEIIAALIGVAVSQFMLWMRFEHRMTVLETKLDLRERQTGTVTERPQIVAARSQ